MDSYYNDGIEIIVVSCGVFKYRFGTVVFDDIDALYDYIYGDKRQSTRLSKYSAGSPPIDIPFAKRQMKKKTKDNKLILEYDSVTQRYVDQHGNLH